MLVALLSDIHDHTTHLLLALHTAQEQGCTHLLFMGDMAEASTFIMLREEWTMTTLHGAQADIVLDSRRIYFCHLPWQAAQAADSGLYDAVFYGHTHTPEVRHAGRTLLANPGEVYGRQNPPSIGIYDTVDNSVRIIPI